MHDTIFDGMIPASLVLLIVFSFLGGWKAMEIIIWIVKRVR